MDINRQKTILVSACLLGLDTRYNGLCKKNGSVIDFLSAEEWIAIPVCPEQLAGLPTPRPAAQFISGDGKSVMAGVGKVENSHHEDMNEVFLKGANQTLSIARLNGCNLALFKERSPSCGIRQIYRNGVIRNGSGVTTALLQDNDIHVFSEDELEQIVSFPNPGEL